MLATLMLGGQPRKVLMQAPKNGFFYVIDRMTGKPISAKPFVNGITWATGIDPVSWRPLDTAGNRYLDAPFLGSPGHAGAHSWPPAAYSPQTGFAYIPTSQNNWLYSAQSTEAHGINPGASEDKLPKSPNYLQAFEPISGKEIWRVDADDDRIASGGGGVLATAGGLVFQGRGEATGYLLAIAAKTGRVLWRHETPNGIMAAPITYSVRGEQYVAVVGGAGGMMLYGVRSQGREPQPGRIYAFKIGGRAALSPPSSPVGTIQTPTESFSASQIVAGADFYKGFCSRCHGAIRRASNVVPDLRRSAAATDAKLWKTIVIDGLLSERGMIGWSDQLSVANAESIRAYVNSETALVARAQRPTE